MAPALAAQIRTVHTAGHSSLAVIAKTARQCQALYRELKALIPIQLITKEEKGLSSGPLIIPSYLAKGLEFDTVLIADCSRDNYHKEEELPLFYTVCTRALHQLLLYYCGEPTPSSPEWSQSFTPGTFTLNNSAKDKISLNKGVWWHD